MSQIFFRSYRRTAWTTKYANAVDGKVLIALLVLFALVSVIRVWARADTGRAPFPTHVDPMIWIAVFPLFRRSPDRNRIGKVKVWIREKGKFREDPIYRSDALHLLFRNPLGRFFMSLIGSRRWFNQLLTLGKYSARSKREILPFIQEHQIDTSEFVETVDSFGSFAEFFNRELRPETRPIDQGPTSVVSPSDGVLQWVISPLAEDTRFVVKERGFTLSRLMESDTEARKFKRGELLGFYLSPFDYHRYCYPYGGRLISQKRIGDRYYSVNEQSVETGFRVFDRNARVCSVFETPSSTWAMIEIGGFYAGSIVDFESPRIAKGSMKGAFQLGGSFIVLAFEAGAFHLDEDISAHLADNQPVRLKLGERLGEFR